MITEEDKVQIALGLKFYCVCCEKVRDAKDKFPGAIYYGEIICIECAYNLKKQFEDEE